MSAKKRRPRSTKYYVVVRREGSRWAQVSIDGSTRWPKKPTTRQLGLLLGAGLYRLWTVVERDTETVVESRPFVVVDAVKGPRMVTWLTEKQAETWLGTFATRTR